MIKYPQRYDDDFINTFKKVIDVINSKGESLLDDEFFAQWINEHYKPKMMGEWDNSNEYEEFSIVTHEGNSYTSKKSVPAGIDIYNEEFWVATGNYNAQVEYYRDEVGQVQEEIRDTKTDLEGQMNDTKSYVDDEVEKSYEKISFLGVNVKDFGAVGDGVTDDTEAINEAITHISDLGGGEVHIPPGVYMIKGHVDDGSSHWGHIDKPHGIMVKDNVDIIMTSDTTMKTIPNSIEWSIIFNLYHVENVSIKGGTLIGDRYEHFHNDSGDIWKQWEPNTHFSSGDKVYAYHRGYEVIGTGRSGDSRPNHEGTVANGEIYFKRIVDNVGEWGMGLHVVGSKNVHLENITMKDMWGDGVMYQRYCENVYTKNVISSNNRRQGASIISMVNGVFENCTFEKTNGTRPEAGVDIEPETHEGLETSVDKVSFIKCVFSENEGRGFTTNIIPEFTSARFLKLDSCIIKGNRDEQMVLTTNGGYLSDIVVKDTLIDKRGVENYSDLLLVTNSNENAPIEVEHVLFENVRIIDDINYDGRIEPRRIRLRGVSHIKFSNCDIKLSPPYSIYLLSGIYISHSGRVTFEGTRITGASSAFRLEGSDNVEFFEVNRCYFEEQLMDFARLEGIGKVKITDSVILPPEDIGNVIEEQLIYIGNSDIAIIKDNIIHSKEKRAYHIANDVKVGMATGNIMDSTQVSTGLVRSPESISENNLIIDGFTE